MRPLALTVTAFGAVGAAGVVGKSTVPTHLRGARPNEIVQRRQEYPSTMPTAPVCDPVKMPDGTILCRPPAPVVLICQGKIVTGADGAHSCSSTAEQSRTPTLPAPLLPSSSESGSPKATPKPTVNNFPLPSEPAPSLPPIVTGQPKGCTRDDIPREVWCNAADALDAEQKCKKYSKKCHKCPALYCKRCKNKHFPSLKAVICTQDDRLHEVFPGIATATRPTPTVTATVWTARGRAAKRSHHDHNTSLIKRSEDSFTSTISPATGVYTEHRLMNPENAGIVYSPITTLVIATCVIHTSSDGQKWCSPTEAPTSTTSPFYASDLPFRPDLGPASMWGQEGSW